VRGYEKAGRCSFFNKVNLLLTIKSAQFISNHASLLGQAKSLLHGVGSPKMPMVTVDLSGDMVLVLHALFHTVYTMLKCNVINKKN
jgi:hypothetical protein